MDRRTWLQAMAGGVVLPTVHGSLGPLLPSRDSLDKIGLQLYTVRSRMELSVERTLYEVSQLGYREVEFAGYFGRPPRAIRQLLDRNDLKSPAAHVQLSDLRGGFYRRLDESAEIGHKWLVVPWLAEYERDSIDAIKETAETMNKAAEDAKGFNIKIAYHNHDFEFQEIDGRLIYDVLLEETDPKLVDMELDLYWMTKAGIDPLEYINRWPKRFPLMHVKDAGPAPEYEMRDVGKGSIDFARIFSQRKQSGMRHAFVEHDNPADPMTSIGTSFRYLKALKFD